MSAVPSCRQSKLTPHRAYSFRFLSLRRRSLQRVSGESTVCLGRQPGAGVERLQALCCGYSESLVSSITLKAVTGISLRQGQAGRVVSRQFIQQDRDTHAAVLASLQCGMRSQEAVRAAGAINTGRERAAV